MTPFLLLRRVCDRIQVLLTGRLHREGMTQHTDQSNSTPATRSHRWHPTTRLAARGFLLAALGVACALVVAACGSTSSAPSTSTTTSTSTTAAGASASATAFRTCLQQHGFAPKQGAGTGAPAGGAGTSTAPSGNQQTAFSACASLRPARGGIRPGAGTGSKSGSATFTAFEECLKKNGVQTGTTTTTQTSAKTTAAITACRKLLPSGGGTSAGSTTTTTG